jgi:putative ABC transport system permease protein
MRQDLRYALRLLRRRPGASALVIGTLAIGIAAATIVFSLADAILWHPLPFRDPDRLVRIRATASAPGAAVDIAAALDHSIFDSVHPFALTSTILSIGGEARGVTIGELSPGLLQALGVAPARGREFSPDEYVAGNTVVIVSADLWRRQQSTAQSADDRTISIEGVPHTIVGVMPAGFEFPVSRVVAWRPYVPSSIDTHVAALGRLRTGATLGQAEALARTAIRTGGGPIASLAIVPFVSVNPTTSTALRILLGAVALLLMIAIANASNIVQAEAVRRDTELAVRASLGASWPRLVRQLSCEALLVAAIAAAVAILVSAWALELLITAVPYLMSFQALRPIGIDWRALTFATAVATVCAIGVSWLTALRARRLDPQEALRGQSSGLARHSRARKVLTVAQIAITLVLLTGAGLLGHGFLNLSRVDPGFDPKHLVDVELRLPEWRYSGEADQRNALARLRDEAARVPGVVDATISYTMPPGLEFHPLDTLVADRPIDAPHSALVSTGVVDDRFFSTLRIPLLAGRAFDVRDGPNTPHVAVVSRSFAQRLWPGRDTLGKTFRESATAPSLMVVGIVGDVINGGFELQLGSLAYYTARAQSPTWWFEGLIVRTASDPERVVPALRSIARRVMPDAPIVDLRSGFDTIANANSRVRFSTLLMIVFASVALAVALTGVYGTFWCLITQRTREIGVRMALGASSGDVLRMVLAGSVRLIAIGVALGLPLALAASRLLKTQLFGVSPGDPMTMALVVAFLAAAALAATYLPARRAAAIDPADALRMQ